MFDSAGTAQVTSELSTPHRPIGVIKHSAHNKYELVVDGVVVSTSKHRDYWEYHQRRGDLPKALAALNVLRYIHETAEPVKQRTSSQAEQPLSSAPPSLCSFAALLEPLSFNLLLDIDELVPKKRGRPPRITSIINEAGSTSRNILSDDEADRSIALNNREIAEIKKEYRRGERAGEVLRGLLESLAALYQVSYREVYVAATK